MTSRAQVAVVTGANRGIGFEIARQLSARALHVVLTGRTEDALDAAARQLQAHGAMASSFVMDVRDEQAPSRLMAYLRAQLGRVDVLVNNAGVILDRGVAGLDVSTELMRETMETNVYGPLRLCQALTPWMRERGYGRVVNVSSELGALTTMGEERLAYRVSKAALNAMTRVLAAELQGSGVLVNAMCPGWVHTDMGGPRAPRSVEQGADTAVWLATLPPEGPTGGFFQDRAQHPW